MPRREVSELKAVHGADGPQDKPAIAYTDEITLDLAGRSFRTRETLPLGTIMRVTDNQDEMTIAGLKGTLMKLVDPDQHDELWDALDDCATEEVGKEIRRVFEAHSPRRPTGRASSSRGGSKSKKRG